MLETFREAFLSSHEFVERAYAAVEALDDQEFFLRSAKETRALLGEILPLATLLKHLETPGRRVCCRHEGGDSHYDGEIQINGREVERGYWAPHYFVEVTTAAFPKEHLRREALSRYGSVFMDPEIKRVGSRRQRNDQIVSQATGEDLDAPMWAAIDWVKERLAEKALNSYPQPCFLIVNVEPERPLSISEWSELAKGVNRCVNRDTFERTFIVEWYGNTVLRL